MKVLVINGSPNIHGCTDRALKEVESVLTEQGIECQRVNVGNKDVRGCIACHTCRKTNKCIFDDLVNETAPIFAESDGILIGSPTYYYTAADVERDKEGLQTMRNLGRNMAFLIKAIDASKEKNGLPEQERNYFTSFLNED